MSGSKKGKHPTIEDLSISDRINRAKSKTQRLVDQALLLIEMHEANKIVVYSSQLSGQIPTSHSAHAFNSFQRGLHHFEIIRLCAIWNGVRPDDLEMISIPAVVQLIDHPDVISTLKITAEQFIGSPGARWYPQDEDDNTQREIERQLVAAQKQFTSDRARAEISRLERSIRLVRGVEKSRRLKSTRNLRDKYLAHNLERSNLEKRGQVEKMKYGDERRLLFQAIAIIDALHIGINGTGFHWQSSFEMARRNAEGLWNKCTFNVTH